MALQNAFGNLALDASVASLKVIDPDGTLQVSNDSKALFLDTFDTTLGKWTTGGTAPSISGGAATFASNTTASTSSYMRTTGAFTLRPQAYLRTGFFVKLGETTTALTNNSRWWGYGQNQTTPTAAAPVLNGAVFLIDYADGSLKGAVYSAGTRTQVINLARPTDASLHKYEIWVRQAVVYYLIDSVVVGTITYPNMAVTTNLYLIAGSTNFTTAPSTAPVLQLSSASMADTSGTVGTIGDGIDPYIQATVKASAGSVATTDTSLVVAMHPNSGLPAGSQTIGYVKPAAPSATDQSLVPYRSVAVTTPVVVKASAGRVRRVRIYNPNTSVAYLQVLNTASSPAFNTNIIEEFVIPASSTYAENIDIPTTMSTGISVAASTAAGGTTAVTTGLHVQIWYA